VPRLWRSSLRRARSSRIFADSGLPRVNRRRRGPTPALHGVDVSAWARRDRLVSICALARKEFFHRNAHSCALTLGGVFMFLQPMATTVEWTNEGSCRKRLVKRWLLRVLPLTRSGVRPDTVSRALATSSPAQ